MTELGLQTLSILILKLLIATFLFFVKKLLKLQILTIVLTFDLFYTKIKIGIILKMCVDDYSTSVYTFLILYIRVFFIWLYIILL